MNTTDIKRAVRSINEDYKEGSVFYIGDIACLVKQTINEMNWDLKTALELIENTIKVGNYK